MRPVVAILKFVPVLLLTFATETALTAQGTSEAFRQLNAYAVVIGISQYREEAVPKVAYAVKDAEAIAQLLESQGGIPKANIKLLTDSKATIGDFRNHFGDWLRMRVKPDSTVYIYYAGHGTPNPKTGEVYMVPWDGHPDFPSGLYPLKELYETLNKLPAKTAIVFLDSCFSGAAGRSVLPKGARPMVISVENPLLAGGKVVVLAAAAGNEISSDYDEVEHGLFTFYLLAGLQGWADGDKSGIVTIGEAYEYIRENVSVASVVELNREQTPVLIPDISTLGRRVHLTLTRVTKVEPELIEEIFKAKLGNGKSSLNNLIHDPRWLELSPIEKAQVLDALLSSLQAFIALDAEHQEAVRREAYIRGKIESAPINLGRNTPIATSR